MTQIPPFEIPEQLRELAERNIEGDYLALLGVPISLLFARLRESGFMAT